MRITLILNVLLILIGCIHRRNINTNEENNSWDALIFLEQTEIQLINNPEEKKSLGYIKNDTITEEYYLIRVIEISNTMARVIAVSGLNLNEPIEGWIEIMHLGIYTRPRNEIGSVLIYKSPNEFSRKSELITNEKLNIIDIKNNWYKVKYIENGVTKTGWLSPKNQCPNPYSTCN